MTIVRRLTAALLATALAVLVPAAAIADPPARLAGQVTDRAGVLGGTHPAVDQALTRLRTDAGIQLFVVFVMSSRSWTRLWPPPETRPTGPPGPAASWPRCCRSPAPR